MNAGGARPKAGRRPAPKPPGLRLVPQSPRRRRLLPFLIASSVLMGPIVFGVVTVQALVSQTSFRMQQISRQNAQLQQSYGELKLQIAQLSSPDRIVQQAKRLGLRLPDPSDVHAIDVPGSGTDRGAGQPSGPLSFSLKRLLGDQP